MDSGKCVYFLDSLPFSTFLVCLCVISFYLKLFLLISSCQICTSFLAQPKCPIFKTDLVFAASGNNLFLSLSAGLSCRDYIHAVYHSCLYVYIFYLFSHMVEFEVNSIIPCLFYMTQDQGKNPYVDR